MSELEKFIKVYDNYFDDRNRINRSKNKLIARIFGKDGDKNGKKPKITVLSQAFGQDSEFAGKTLVLDQAKIDW
ncbi:hypothetical protein [Calothrix sp. NIES-3974]|uniref:hypothetical protein n=1 Tax=Calothrix sp. NIES-3974 TaxID=2005462 RepID=UPI000BBC8ED5|nr:hypothetical protein [Calothrix sp. NIES-3974]